MTKGEAGWPAVLVRERPRPPAIRDHPDAWRLAVATVCFGAFMGQLDASIVTLTYHSLRVQFHAPLAGVEWVSLAYLLTLVALLVPVGRLADARGRKLFYLYGFVVFTAASAACGLAPSLGALIAFRVVQAAGAAMLQANSVALVATSAPPEKMRTALGVQAAAQALGLAIGPTVGAALVATVGWRWVFGINVPIGVVAVVAGHFLLPRTRSRNPVPAFDWWGLAWLATATTSLLLGVSAASGLPLPPWVVAALFAAAVAAGVAFVLRQRRARVALLDLGLLRLPAVSPGLAGALSGYLVLFGPLVLVPIVLVRAGCSEVLTGVVVSALPAGFALAATGAERVLPRSTTDRGRCLLGAVVAGGALACMLVVPVEAGWTALLLALLGVGLGVFTPANNTLIMRAFPVAASGTGGGLVNMTRGLGTALGVALVTLALHLAPAGSVAPAARRGVTVLLAAAGVMLPAAWLSPRRTASDSGTVTK
ncbi:MFS transporter [Streptomyces sp. NBC_01450]|uniref:MFS transporter n=1 Tax=Streptomyces sp. NBC_01450 TaxID=2903871 RepID=UPI002E2FFC13|nr:MFS transporter [Streptomyces sp. NBC_01450]